MNDARWTKEIKERDGNMCRRCGFDRNLESHHILPKKEYPRFEKIKYNGITLCGNCHTLLKDKETRTNLRGFLQDDKQIDIQLKALLDFIEKRNIRVDDHIKEFLAGDDRAYHCLSQLRLEDAQMLMKLKKYKQVIAYCDEAILHKSDYIDAYFLRGRAKVEQRYYSAAISDYDIALSIRPNDIYGYILRVIAKQRSGDNTGGIADYDMVIKLSPAAPAWVWRKRGYLQYIIGDYHAAIVDCDKAIQLGYDGMNVYRDRGCAKLKIEHYEAAVDDFQQALSFIELEDAETAEIYRFMADGYCGVRDKEAALYCLNDAIELKDDDPTLYTYRAELNDTLRQYENAINDYDTAIRLNPNDADTYLARGLVKYFVYYEPDRENEAFVDLKPLLV